MLIAAWGLGLRSSPLHPLPVTGAVAEGEAEAAPGHPADGAAEGEAATEEPKARRASKRQAKAAAAAAGEDGRPLNQDLWIST